MKGAIFDCANREEHMSERTAKAYAIVDRYWKWAAGAGFIPIPLLDFAAVTGVQLKMIADLAKFYDVPFQKERARAVVGALIGAASSPIAAVGTLSIIGPALKFLPGIGTAVGVVVTPAFNAAATYALGRVFVLHFESGGTLLDLNPDEIREFFHRELQAAR